MKTPRIRMLGPTREEVPSLGYCIYCKATGVELTTEHVIPRALGGRLEFLEASCGECREKTQKDEEVCFRQLFFRYRVRRGYPTTHRKEWPSTFPILAKDEAGNLTTINIPVHEYPRFIALPAIPLPGILYGRDPSETVPLKLSLGYAPYDVKLIQQKYAEKGHLGKFHFDTNSFCRMLAKMAHGFVLARIPRDKLDLFKFLLPDIICRKVGNYLQLVGGVSSPLPRPQTGQLFEMTIITVWGTDRHEFLGVRISLFPDIGARVYTVVAAERLIPSKPPSQGIAVL